MTDKKTDYYELGKYPNFDRLCELMRQRRTAREPRPLSESSYELDKYPNFDRLCENIRERLPAEQKESFEAFAGAIEKRIQVQELKAEKESK